MFFVCSTIIETGIDVPNANTIIIERADKLGLRSCINYVVVLDVPSPSGVCLFIGSILKHLKGDAEKRLDAIQRVSTLGAGFMLATEDLEIRGAVNYSVSSKVVRCRQLVIACIWKC